MIHTQQPSPTKSLSNRLRDQNIIELKQTSVLGLVNFILSEFIFSTLVTAKTQSTQTNNNKKDNHLQAHSLPQT